MRSIIIGATIFLTAAKIAGAQTPGTDAVQRQLHEVDILTPPAPATPRINGLKIFGVRPGSPFLYSIPATGDRPIKFSADGLPHGLQLDADTGRITGALKKQDTYPVVLRASNSLGQAERPFKIVVGDEIGLTPAMGWNNYNLTGAHIDQKTVLAQAHAMVDSGLAQHGWVYCNTDDGWQGLRGGKLNTIQPDGKDFPDIAGMVQEIHGLGLKAGIYSSPWVTTYDRHIGGTSENADGDWSRDYAETNNHDHSQKFPFVIGKYHFAKQDARQFALWGFDYLKYDWAPVHDDATKEMFDDLRATRRDFLFSWDYPLDKPIMAG